MTRALVSLVLALPLAGCSNLHALHPDDTELQLLVPADGDDEPVGWVYALDLPGGGNRCVVAYGDRTWALAELTEEGELGEVLAEGDLDVGGFALDFPDGALADAKRLFLAGDVRALYRGRIVLTDP